MNLVQLHREINEHFPKVWIKGGSLFSNDHCESLWTGEGSTYTFNVEGEQPIELPVFDYWSGFSLYECGVLKEFAQFLRDRGYFAEPYDPGTYFIWKI